MGLALATGLRPGRLHLLGAIGEQVRPGAAGDPAVAEAGRASEGGVAPTADDEAGAPSIVGPTSSAVPDLLDPLQHRVEAAAAPVGLDAAGLVVVVARRRGQCRGEAAAGERLQAERLLGQLDRVGPQRPEQDRGAEPDPLGDRGGRGERVSGS